MPCCCGGSTSSGSFSACCNNCMRVQFPGMQFYGCDYAVFPDFASIPAGNYRLIPNVGDPALCLTNSTLPDLYGIDGVTEDGRLQFVTSQRESDGRRIITAYLACDFVVGVSPSIHAISIATYVCSNDDCQCNSIGDYSLEGVAGEIPDPPTHAEWPGSISIVDQATLTDPSGPPGSLTVSWPCRSTYSPPSVTIPLLNSTVDFTGHTFATWGGKFSNNQFGTISIQLYVFNSCGYVSIFFINMEFGGGGGTDGSNNLFPFPSNGGDTPVFLGNCGLSGGSGAFGDCPCPTTTANISW